MSNQITVGRNTYSSVAEAWRELSPVGLPLVTVRWRLKQGWKPKLAFKLMPVSPEMRRKYKDLRISSKK